VVTHLTSASGLEFIGVVSAAGAIGGFLTWAFQGVGPSTCYSIPTQTIPDLNALLVGNGKPRLAWYAGAKVRPSSYVPLVQAILDELDKEDDEKDASILILQSPFNVYAFKPSSVAKVLTVYSSIQTIAGHSIGGLWAIEFCRDLKDSGLWPKTGLNFAYVGVHGSSIDFSKFRDLPFKRVLWTLASNDVTMRNACGGDIPHYVEKVKRQLPESANVVVVEGGNHEQYGSYGSPGYAQGLAYKDLEATITEEEQRGIVAKALASLCTGRNKVGCGVPMSQRCDRDSL